MVFGLLSRLKGQEPVRIQAPLPDYIVLLNRYIGQPLCVTCEEGREPHLEPRTYKGSIDTPLTTSESFTLKGPGSRQLLIHWNGQHTPFAQRVLEIRHEAKILYSAPIK